MNPRGRLRSAARRVTDPVETLAQQVTERVIDLLVDALDIDQLVARVDPNAILDRVDVDAVLLIDRWVRRLLRRGHPGPSAPPALLPAQAGP